MSTASEIKAFALSLGFCKAGVTGAQRYERVLSEASARQGYDRWLKRFQKGADPICLMENAKSVIVLAYDYARCHFPENLLPLVGRAYLSRSYPPAPDSAVHQMLAEFEDYLRKKDIAFVTDSKLLMRPAAEQAGVASFGQNNFAYVDDIGSFVILYGYVVDRELEHDRPYTSSKCPPNCRACVNACPTNALYAPFKLDPRKCIGYSNWMLQGENVSDAVVPREIRSKLGCHIHGCDLCQEACPRNKATFAGNYPRDALLEGIGERFSLQNLLHMPEGFYEECVQPIMYSYMRDKRYFQRNAAIAMGNTKDQAYIPDLISELSNPEEIIRLHVAWALGQMDDDAARHALQNRMQQEDSAIVMDEIKIALSNSLY